MPPPRIAFVAPRFPEGATVGGAETLLKALAHRARAAGCDVVFLATCARDHFTWRNEHPPGARVVDGLPVHFFPVDSDRDPEAFAAAQAALCRSPDPDEEVQADWVHHGVRSRALLDYLRASVESFDRVVAGPYLFALVLQVMAAFPRRAVLLPCLHDEPFARVGAVADMFRGAERIIFNTDVERDLAVTLYGLDPARGRVVGMGIDTFETDPTAFAKRRGLTSPYVLYAGRREPMKGTPLLLDYLQAFRSRTGRDVRLVLTGSGPVDPPPGLRPFILDAGFVDEQEKRDAMAGAAVFCHPSVNESLSIVLLESWMARTPVLVHAGSAVMAEHCRRSNGGLWFRCYPEFEESLLALLENKALQRAMGEAGREYVEREYAWPAVERRLREALEA